MKTSTLLRDAKKHLRKDSGTIWSGRQSGYICGAIELAQRKRDMRGSRGQAKAANIALDHILVVLAPHVSVQEWLSVEHPRVYASITQSGQMQEYRHAWLDKLIAEFDDSGN